MKEYNRCTCSPSPNSECVLHDSIEELQETVDKLKQSTSPGELMTFVTVLPDVSMDWYEVDEIQAITKFLQDCIKTTVLVRQEAEAAEEAGANT